MRALDHVHRELRLAQAATERAKQRLAVLQLDSWRPIRERAWKRALIAFRESLRYKFVVEERDGIWEHAMRRARGAS